MSLRDITSGTVIDDRYEILSRVGSGGMADVYCALDRQLGRKVALKLLYRRFAEDAEFVERFRREASAAAGLQHPNVVGVYDRGEWEGTYYIAMEYLEGRSLKRLISEEAPLEPERAIDLALQILKAARFAHKRGIIHRDLKPHNAIVDEEDRLKVTDFGIARAGASDMTETGSILGTAQYLSPEQAQGHAVSAASDLYAIGIVLYEMLTGRVPFQGDSPVTIALKQVNEAPVSPRAINPAVSPELEAVVMHALQKDPAARFNDAESFIAALQAAREGVAAVPAGQATAAFAPPPVPPAEPSQLTPLGGSLPPPVVPDPWAYAEEPPLPPVEPRRRARWPWVLLVVLLLAGGGVAAYLLTRPEQVRVPDVVRKDVGTATAILGNEGFRADVTTVTSASAPQGRVIRQDPQPGSKVDKGSTIGLVVSGGPGTATIPDVGFKSERTARRQLRRAGFTKVTTSDESSTAVDKGKVIRTSPIVGSVVSKNTPITVFVSSGPEQVPVPSVVGKSRADAQNALRDAGLRSTVTTRESSSKDPGTVLEQSPGPNTDVDKGSVVKLVVAKAPEKVDVPDLVGLSEDDADGALVDAGLKVRTERQDVTAQDQDGTVIDQDPSAGRSVRKGTRVTITVGHFVATPPEGTPTTP